MVPGKVDHSSIITILLIILCGLAAYDVWCQYVIGDHRYWNEWYSLALRSDETFWKLGFRIENIQIKAEITGRLLKNRRELVDDISLPTIRSRLSTTTHQTKLPLLDTSSLSRSKHIDTEGILRRHDNNFELSKLTVNLTNVFNIHCNTEFGNPIRVGLNDYHTEPDTACNLFNGDLADSKTSPHYMFERVDLGDGSFALRSIATNYYVSALPPDSGTDSTKSDYTITPWSLTVNSPTIGAHERFRLTEENLLYSCLLGTTAQCSIEYYIYIYIYIYLYISVEGFFQCNAENYVRGYSNKYGNYNQFVFTPVDPEDYRVARELSSLSKKLVSIQDSYIESHKPGLEASQVNRSMDMKTNTAPIIKSTIKIAIAIPVTSKGTVMATVSESPLWSNFFDSFMKSIDWRSNRYCFKIYVGFDKADSIYDTGDAWSELRSEFASRAEFRMKEQLMDDIAIHSVLRDTLSIKLMHFEDLHGAPSQVVSQLVLSAYSDGFDYFYQVSTTDCLESCNA